MSFKETGIIKSQRNLHIEIIFHHNKIHLHSFNTERISIGITLSIVYSPDLAPSNNFLFSKAVENLKERCNLNLKKQKFSFDLSLKMSQFFRGEH